jgi:serine/threonine-protein kinase
MGHASEPQAAASRTGADTGAAAAADLTGRTLGDFHILRRLGEGGMGQVYLAEQISLKRRVALKLLRTDLAANATALQRFRAEATAVARATHANIVQVYAIDEKDGIHYMALEYVEGRNLRQYLEKKGPPEPLLALSIIRQVAAALQRASELGIIHRDIKPENILLTRKGEVKVADFGLSRCFADDTQPLNLTRSGVTMGTPLYMSPEQVEGKPLDPRTDIYSFGVTCYYLLAGEPPFRGQSAFEVAVQHVQVEPVPLAQIRPDLPRELCALVHRMMAKKPDERFQTGREIVREAGRLRDALVGVTGAQAPLISLGPTPPQPSDVIATQAIPLARRRRWLAWAVPLTVLLALAGGLGYGYRRHLGEAAAVPLAAAPAENPNAARARERRLLERVKDNADPKNQLDLSSGLSDRISLGLLYLKERRLGRADEFFKQLQKVKQVDAYHVLGMLGEAMVLAFEDRATESLQKFRAALNAKPFVKLQKGLGSKATLGPLYEMIAEALNFNHANLGAAEFAGTARRLADGKVGFLNTLENLRRPPQPNRFGPGVRKGGKG